MTDWLFEQICWDAAAQFVDGAAPMPQGPKRGMSAKIDDAVPRGALLVTTNQELLAAWAKRAEALLLNQWQRPGDDARRASDWAEWHRQRMEIVNKQLQREITGQTRMEILLTAAATRFDEFADAALNAGVLGIRPT